MTQAVFALRQELTQAVTEGMVEQAHRAVMEQRTAACPQCGQMVSARAPQDRTVETLVGAVRLRRPYFYCERCQLGRAPLDATLGLADRRKQPDVQKAIIDPRNWLSRSFRAWALIHQAACSIRRRSRSSFARP